MSLLVKKIKWRVMRINEYLEDEGIDLDFRSWMKEI